jgi:hypothetical protein
MLPPDTTLAARPAAGDPATPIDAVAATELWYGSTGYDLASGLRACNWRIDGVGLDDFDPAGGSLAHRAVARAARPYFLLRYNNAIIDAVERVGARVMLTVKGNFITTRTLAELGRRGVIRLVYYPDYHFDHPGVTEEKFAHFDLIVTTKSFQVDALAAIAGRDRVAFLHHGYSSVGMPVVTDAPTEMLWDVCFVGNASPHKLAYLQAIAGRLPGIRMLVVGNGWEIARGTPLESMVLGYALIGDFLSRLVARSRINVAVHFGKHARTGWEDFVSRRTFEIPAYGGFMLHIDNREVRELYDVGTEVDVFSTPAQLADKVAFYLENPGLADASARRAHARANPAYGIVQRARSIDELVRTRFPSVIA